MNSWLNDLPLSTLFDQAFEHIRLQRENFQPALYPIEVGKVKQVSNGVAIVSGLPGVKLDELVKFPGDIFGIASDIDETEIGVVLLGDYWLINAGDEVRRTNRVMDIAVGEDLLGRAIDPLGRPVDGGKALNLGRQQLPIERPAPPIIARAPVTEPLQTGLKVLDALLPIGRGQRELILGDRQTGKTSIAVDIILNQHDQDVICIYCAIGQRAASVAKTLALLRHHNALEYTLLVVAQGSDAPGLAYICPYAATSIGEYFMQSGRDVLIVYDDLTQHARAYRELSLLLRRTPGREAFPADIFYIHSRLLERATHLKEAQGGGSLTALPVVETEAQNMAAYIPTNLISITDGQIYLSPTLFDLGVLPAVDVGKSVSRVGGNAQRPSYRAISGPLKLAYAQFEELENFARFGARLDDSTAQTIEHGRRIRACLKQAESSPLSVGAQMSILLALSWRLFDAVPLNKMSQAELALLRDIQDLPDQLAARLGAGDKLSETDENQLRIEFRQRLQRFYPVTGSVSAPITHSTGAQGS